MDDVLQIQGLAENLAYLIYSLRRLDTVLDLLLVTILFFVMLMLIRRSQAALMLRGILILALLLITIIALLPLPTLNWLLLRSLLIGLIAIPLVFQQELRRGLERLGRSIGFLNLRPTELVHRVVPMLVRATVDMSERKIGALIVLEGEAGLSEVINTGVVLHAALSDDLLQTIFFDKTPLHDGAVVIREDNIVAAACVLPLSEQVLPMGMHQGTRHRAALGMSEHSDCLALVVSEETGQISVAQRGRLQRNLESTELRDRLYRFYDPLQDAGNSARGPNRWISRLQRLARLSPRIVVARLLAYATTFLLAILLAVATWLLVADQVNPPLTQRIDSVELRLLNQSREMQIVSTVPKVVAVEAQAPQDLMDSLEPQSFRATLDLAGLDAGVHRLVVQVRPSDPRVRVLTSDPVALDVDLEPRAERVLPVVITISDRDSLPFSYEIEGEPIVNPAEITVTGAADLVEQVAGAEVVVALRSTRTTLEEERAVVLKDGAGNTLTGLTTEPDKVKVTVPIRQRFNTRDAAVHAVITGTLPTGYWISNISVEPKTVTLLGAPAVLGEMGGFVDTAPIDVTGAAGDVVRRIPLAPPQGVSALNERGVTEGSVEVTVTIVPQLGNLRLTLPVVVTGAPEGVTVSSTPALVDVLLSGPLPVLDQVNLDQKLVRVLVDVSELSLGTYDLVPELIAPETLKATLLPDKVQVRLGGPVQTPAAGTPAPSTSPTPTQPPS